MNAIIKTTGILTEFKLSGYPGTFHLVVMTQPDVFRDGESTSEHCYYNPVCDKITLGLYSGGDFLNGADTFRIKDRKPDQDILYCMEQL